MKIYTIHLRNKLDEESRKDLVDTCADSLEKITEAGPQENNVGKVHFNLLKIDRFGNRSAEFFTRRNK